MTKDPQKSFFKDPHSHSEMVGNLTCKVYFSTSKKYPNTCSACSNLANVWDKDNQSYLKGIDNYNATLEKMLQMLDVFIREESKGKRTGGQQHNYSLSDDCEITILLLWQIRNVMAHNGIVIDQKCKTKYERIFRKMGKSNHPIINLPNTLELNSEFVMHQENFDKVKKCIFGYIKRKTSKEDFKILASRATMANFQITDGFAFFPLRDGKLGFSIRKAAAYGVHIDSMTGKLLPPPGTIFSFDDSRIHLENGDSFPAQYILNSEDDGTRSPDLEL